MPRRRRRCQWCGQHMAVTVGPGGLWACPTCLLSDEAVWSQQINAENEKEGSGAGFQFDDR